MPAVKPLLGPKDVAYILDMSPDDVICLARTGKLRATKTGRFWRFRHRDVSAYKRKREREMSRPFGEPFVLFP